MDKHEQRGALTCIFSLGSGRSASPPPIGPVSWSVRGGSGRKLFLSTLSSGFKRRKLSRWGHLASSLLKLQLPRPPLQQVRFSDSATGDRTLGP